VKFVVNSESGDVDTTSTNSIGGSFFSNNNNNINLMDIGIGDDNKNGIFFYLIFLFKID